MQKGVSFKVHTFGCRVNQAESEVLKERMIQEGFLQNSDKYKIIVINSCAVTHKAEREVRQFIYQEKRKNPDVFLVVTGCAATYWKRNKVYIKEIDLLIDNTEKEYVAKMIKKRFENRGVKVKKLSLGKIQDKYFSSKRALIKIQDGCDRFCSYCIVPYLRGLPRSVKIDEILARVRMLEKDIAEVIYTAINTEDFGKENKETLIELIKRTLQETKIKRLSFGSIHPWSITKEFIRFYKENLNKSSRFVKFFHIPIQSASNNVLYFMKRGYTREELYYRFNALHEANPESFLATDVIVGFLGETEKDFLETYSFLRDAPVFRFHVFRFSVRKNTAAFYLKKRLFEPSESIKKERAKVLRELSEKKLVKFKKRFVDKVREALFLSKSEEDFQAALLHNQLPVMVKNSKVTAGEIREIKIVEVKKGVLVGALPS